VNLNLWQHKAAFWLFLLSGAVVMGSWWLQKHKATKRFEAVLGKGIVEYRNVQSTFERGRYKNIYYDAGAGGLLALGVLLEWLVA
jgi:hypothetical protein